MHKIWYEIHKRKAGVVGQDIADEMGRSQSAVSRIIHGDQEMSMDWARAFSKVLQIPLTDVLREFGLASEEEAQHFSPGFSESEAVPYLPPERERPKLALLEEAMGGGRPGVDLWRVKSTALAAMGYLDGDTILVDTHASERTRAGDIVVAQIYDAGTAITVLRRHEPPVLVSYGTDPEALRVDIVDGRNVVIRGKVIASWRSS